MLLQVLLPAWAQFIGLEVGVYDEFPAVSWLCHLHLLIEDFLPLTSGQAGRHGPVGLDGNVRKNSLRKNTESLDKSMQSGQSLRSKKPYPQDPAPSSVTLEAVAMTARQVPGARAREKESPK